ncbi:bacitracin resistance protein [Microbacterium sp.]|uniref:bacitracin resistance protein n=1 Tax=Microbacterium sp. TaxID=51671 RepID=UPI0025D07595|nr:bacitracin resistance protein [Microbacterium sp.]
MGAERAVRRRTLPTWVLVGVSTFFGLFYAYAVWNAIGFLATQASGPLGLNAYGWFVLLLAVLFPLAAFGVAFALGSRRSWWELALVLLAGLGLVAVFWLNVVAYSAVYGASLLG